MPSFKVMLNHNRESSAFLDLFSEKLSSDPVAGLVYVGGVKERVRLGGFLYAVVDISPNFFPFWKLGLFFNALLFLWLGWSWWLLPGFVLLSSFVFWTDWFYYLMFRLGIKKSGYVGVLKRVRLKKSGCVS